MRRTPAGLGRPWLLAGPGATAVVVAVLVAGATVVVCGVATFVLMMYVGSGLHGASWSNVGLMLPFTAWGVASGLAVLRGKPSSRKWYAAWAGATSLAVAGGALAGVLGWAEAGLTILPLLLAGATVLLARGVAD